MRISDVKIQYEPVDFLDDDLAHMVRLVIEMKDDEGKTYSHPWLIKEFDTETEATACAKMLSQLFE